MTEKEEEAIAVSCAGLLAKRADRLLRDMQFRLKRDPDAADFKGAFEDEIRSLLRVAHVGKGGHSARESSSRQPTKPAPASKSKPCQETLSWAGWDPGPTEDLLKKEVGEAKNAHEVDLAVAAYLQRMALAEERKANRHDGPDY